MSRDILTRATAATRRALLRLADRLVPPHLALYETSIGLYRTHVVGTIAELGVADLLADGPSTAGQLAARLEVDAGALHRLLRAAACEGLLRLDRAGRFSLRRTGQTLRRDRPRSMHHWARYFALRSTAAAWGDLTASVRTGRSAFSRVHGVSVWDWYGRHPEEERLFAGAMRWRTEEQIPRILAGYPWPEDGTICDLGGGVGTLLAAILRARPRARGVLVDAQGVLEAAGRYLREQGVGDRVELVEGDLFGHVRATADLYVLKQVLHDWDDAACAHILQGVRATMPPGSRLVLVETLQEPNVLDPSLARMDLHMLTQCEAGRERSGDELRELLGSAGLVPGALRRTAGPALLAADAPHELAERNSG